MGQAAGLPLLSPPLHLPGTKPGLEDAVAILHSMQSYSDFIALSAVEDAL